MGEDQELINKMGSEFQIQFKNLGQALVDLTPEDWEKLYFLGRVENNSFTGNYILKVKNQIENKEKYFDFFDEKTSERFNDTITALEEIYIILKKYEQSVFNELIFILESNGKFEVKYLYQEIEEDDYFSERFQNWKKEIEKEEFGEMGSEN